MKKKLSALLVVLLSFVMMFSMAASAEEESSTAAGPSVQIVRYQSVSSSKDSTGAHGIKFYYNNYSGKTIKYIRFWATPYNRVNDPVACTVTGKTQACLEVTGPIKPTTYHNGIIEMYKDKDGNYYIYQYKQTKTWWGGTKKVGIKQYLSNDELLNGTYSYVGLFENVWYNSTIYQYTIDKVEVIYMDGTEETLSYEETQKNVINLREKYPYYVE